MSSADPDHKTSFLRNYELYEAAKERGESEEIQRFALLALNQIHLVSDVPAHADREANAQVMHDLLGPSHTEAEVREKYDQLRDDAGVWCLALSRFAHSPVSPVRPFALSPWPRPRGLSKSGMAESDETEKLRAKSKALKKECIMAVAQTEQIKKAIRIASTQHQNEPWSAEFVAKWQSFLDRHGVQYFWQQYLTGRNAGYSDQTKKDKRWSLLWLFPA
jgi:hypothetical protein